MAMGIVSDDEFDTELTKPGTIESNTEPTQVGRIIDSPVRGRGVGNVEVPNSLRKIIGDTSVVDGRSEAIELGRNFGISPSSVSAYGVGSTSTASYDERPNLGSINAVKERVSKRARNKLMLALKNITDEKLGEAKVRDLAGVARDMSAVIKNMEPDSPVNKNEKSGPTFVFYSPQIKKEETFDVVYAKE